MSPEELKELKFHESHPFLLKGLIHVLKVHKGWLYFTDNWAILVPEGENNNDGEENKN
jgi:hypothetical protein